VGLAGQSRGSVGHYPQLGLEGFFAGAGYHAMSVRGYSGDHPRVHLLRYRSLGAEHRVERSEVPLSAKLLDTVRADWRATGPLTDWLDRHVTG
jgi:hypothetical protein